MVSVTASAPSERTVSTTSYDVICSPSAAAAGPAADTNASHSTGSRSSSQRRVGHATSDDRTNTLIVVSSEAGYLRVKSLVERLDILLDTEGGSAIHVYPLNASGGIAPIAVISPSAPPAIPSSPLSTANRRTTSA